MMTIVVVIIAILGFISCGDDDNGGGNETSILQNIMCSKWVMSSTDYSTWSDEMSMETQTWTIYFTSDYEGVIHYVSREKDTYFGNSKDEDHIKFNYYVEGNIVYLNTGWGYSDIELIYYGNYMMWGDDVFEKKEMTSSDYEYLQDDNQGYHGTEGKIDTEVYIINDNEILKGVDDLGNGWYSYVLQFGFGANSDDAYRKGMTQMKLTVWADNGCLDTSYKTSNYGKKKTYTLYLSSTERDWYDWIFVLSKDTKITFNYKLEYYNSKDGQWYDIQSRKLTFYK